MSRRNRERREENRRRRLAEQRRPVAAVPGDGSVFRLAEQICGVTLRDQGRAALASGFDAVSTSDADIAHAYAAGYRPEFQQEAFDGAMAALQGETLEPAEETTA